MSGAQPDTLDPIPAGSLWPQVVVCVVGATASGKTDVSLELARLLGAEIISADAYQVYRGMDIGTAKATQAQRAGVTHHLIDILDIHDELSVAQFQAAGRSVLADLATRGVPAVVVGGSGLYVRALLDDLRFPGSDPAIRAAWERRLERDGPRALHALLAQRDPDAAAVILPSNGRRIVRALEVGELTGGPFAASLPRAGPPMVAHLSIGLDVEDALLEQRIAQRVDRMLAEGLLDEVRDLRARGLAQCRTAGRALGYGDVLAHLEGSLDLDEVREAIVGRTRRFARRQVRWFRRDPRTQWLDGTTPPSSTASSITSLLGRSGRTLWA